MRKVLFLLLILAIPSLLLAEEPVREWKSKNGKTFIEASLDDTKETDNPEMVYLLKEGKRYRVPFKNLSQADQDYVTEIRNGGRDIEIVPAAKRYVLLIGVNEYAKPIKSLQFCVSDMNLLADSFEKIGVPKKNIFLLTDDSPSDRRPTGENIRRQIETVTSLMKPDAQLIVAFSGHGVIVDGKSYFCPSDADLKDINSIVSCDWVFEQLEKCKAKQKAFIIDVCRDEIAFDGGNAVEQARILDDQIGADAHGFILIVSCDKKQKSLESPDIHHGVFMYFLAEGLAGAAKDKDGYVSVMNLFQYASSRTKKFVYFKLSELQVPTFNHKGETADFRLAKVEENPSPSPTSSAEQTPSSPQPPSSSLKAGDRITYTINGVEFAFRWCPPGTFMMGSPNDEPGKRELSNYLELDINEIEKQHKVTLTKGFWIMETEVTVGMFKAFVNDTGYESIGDAPYVVVDNVDQHNLNYSWRNPGFTQDDSHPVTCVSWNDAKAFCKWLSKKTGQNINLPTEAQWEYACRAGSTTAIPNGTLVFLGKSNAPALDVIAWYSGNASHEFVGHSGADSSIFEGTQYPGGPCGTHPVKKKKPNNWGLYDMIGNVAEWCLDWLEDYPSWDVTDPLGPSGGSRRIMRGGSWAYYAWLCRSASRGSHTPEERTIEVGFRCVGTITNPEK